VTTHVAHPKSSAGFALGLSWVIGERDLIDLSASLSDLSGYLDDPYKVVPVGAVTAPEHRPDARSRYAFLAKYGHYFVDARGALKLTYRYYTDSWAIDAHTVEVFYDQRFGSRWVVSPSVRLYTQSHASFFTNALPAPQTYMSADYRLSAFDSVLGGLAVSYAIRPNLILSLAGTYQDQMGRDRVTLSAPPPEPEDGESGDAVSVSAADLRVLTATVGLLWRY